MIEIKRATKTNIDVLALLGRITYAESHGDFIADKNDLLKYCAEAFSIDRTQQDVSDPDNHFYIIYSDDLPVGYAKLVLNATHEGVNSRSNCRLERIYILSDFLPLKIGQQFLEFVEEQAKEMQVETMWLSVYMKNQRAIRFYQKNKFNNVGELDFLVNGTEYKTIVFSKNIR